MICDESHRDIFQNRQSVGWVSLFDSKTKSTTAVSIKASPAASRRNQPDQTQDHFQEFGLVAVDQFLLINLWLCADPPVKNSALQQEHWPHEEPTK